MSVVMAVLAIAVGLAGLGVVLWGVARAGRERTAAMRGVAEGRGWSFQEKPPLEVIPERERFELFRQGSGRRARNFMAGSAEGARVAVLDYSYTIQAGQTPATRTQTVACCHVGTGAIPAFTARPEHVFHRIGSAFGFQDIDLEAHPGFSRAFLLRGADVDAVRGAFTPAVAAFFEEREGVSAAAEGAVVFLWRDGRAAAPDAAGALADDAVRLARLLAEG